MLSALRSPGLQRAYGRIRQGQAPPSFEKGKGIHTARRDRGPLPCFAALRRLSGRVHAQTVPPLFCGGAQPITHACGPVSAWMAAAAALRGCRAPRFRPLRGGGLCAFVKVHRTGASTQGRGRSHPSRLPFRTSARFSPPPSDQLCHVGERLRLTRADKSTPRCGYTHAPRYSAALRAR
jgi:hypothetical protein